MVQGPEVLQLGKVEGTRVCDILLDTGCSRTLVHKDLVSEESLLAGKAVAIRCAHGDTVLYPLAQVQLEVEGQAMEVTVAVADKLPMSVLLGTDTPLLSKLLSGELQKTRSVDKIDNALVVTRPGVRKQLEEELEAGDVLLDVQPKALETLSEEGMAVGPEAKPTPEKEAPADQMMSLDPEWSSDDEIFVGGREKAKLIKGKKRKNNA